MMGDCKKISLILSLLALALVAVAALTQEDFLSAEENLELERQLEAINKPAIKSFRTKHGEIFDCVDIHQQHAFDHPLLKNHTLQLKPQTVPDWITNKTSRKGNSPQFLPQNIACPNGTVIIKRASKIDLINAQKLKSLGFSFPGNSGQRSNGVDLRGHHSAVLEFRNKVFGATSNINVWDLEVSPDQFSLASMWIVNGPREEINSVQAGWIVNPALYQSHSRLYTYWTADGYKRKGCFNTLCPGFVQVSTKIPLGGIITPVSTYKGQQYEIAVSIYQDGVSGHWWFVLGGVFIGYWPKALFTASGLAEGASFVQWGGEVYSPMTETSPPMGSGHFPRELLNNSAYVDDIKVVDVYRKAQVPGKWDLKTYADHPQCYDVKYETGPKGPWIISIFFGGPGKCTF